MLDLFDYFVNFSEQGRWPRQENSGLTLDSLFADLAARIRCDYFAASARHAAFTRRRS
jgi:hypothetical protein